MRESGNGRASAPGRGTLQESPCQLTRVCRLVGFSRSAAWAPLKRRNDEPLRARLKTLAEYYPRYGYPTLQDMLKIDGLVVNRKRTYRLYREEGLQVQTKRRKKLVRPRVPMPVPDLVDQRCSMDFVSDQLANGRRARRHDPTSNRGFSEWGEVFGDPVVAAALLDWLLHHAIVIEIATAIACANMLGWCLRIFAYRRLRRRRNRKSGAADHPKTSTTEDVQQNRVGIFTSAQLGKITSALTRARAGTRTPVGALAVAHQRHHKAEFDAALTRCDEGDELLLESVDQGNSLVRKLLRMQQRSKDPDRRQ